MALVRVGYGKYLDPWTREPVNLDVPPIAIPVRQPEPVYVEREPHRRGSVSDAQVLEAIRRWHGNVNAASVMLAITRQALSIRIGRIRERSGLPPDVERLLSLRAKPKRVAR